MSNLVSDDSYFSMAIAAEDGDAAERIIHRVLREKGVRPADYEMVPLSEVAIYDDAFKIVRDLIRSQGCRFEVVSEETRIICAIRGEERSNRHVRVVKMKVRKEIDKDAN